MKPNKNEKNHTVCGFYNLIHWGESLPRFSGSIMKKGWFLSIFQSIKYIKNLLVSIIRDIFAKFNVDIQ